METFIILGWVANIFFIYGVWIIGDKNVKGFYLNGLGNLFYAWQAPLTNNHPLFCLSILLIVINLKGIYQWQFRGKKSKLKKLFLQAIYYDAIKHPEKLHSLNDAWGDFDKIVENDAGQKYQCPICKRSKFDRNYQPHICNGTFRKKLPLFKKVIQNAEKKYNSELMKYIDREDR